MSVSSTTPYVVATQTYPYPADNTSLLYTLTWTNLGPLTTTFTPPVNCNPPDPIIYVNTLDSGQQYDIAIGCDRVASTPPVTRLTCEPSGTVFSSFVSTNWSSYYSWQTYLSPGISCPSGYSTANTITVDSANTSAISIFTYPTPGTHVWCCPTGYTYNQSAYWCASDIKTTLTTGLCDPACGIESGSSSCALATPFTWNPGNTSVTVSAYLDAVYMIHQGSDLHKGGLSTGAKIAIGVVVPVVVLIAITAGALVLMRRLKKKREARAGGQAPWSGAPLREVQQL